MRFNDKVKSILERATVNMDNVKVLRGVIKKMSPELRKRNLTPSYADIEEIAKRKKLKYTDDEIEYVLDEIEDLIK